MLENEMWQKCPVNKGFSIMDVKEVRKYLNPVSSPIDQSVYCVT